MVMFAPRRSRWLLALGALLMVPMYWLPLWRVELTAPQYPEGIGMQIRLHTVTGIKENDLQNINGLNHYIGMQTIEPDAIPELRWMPWVIGVFIVGGLLAAWVGRRWSIRLWTGVLMATCVGLLIDFWKWEYDYGHNLDLENAPITIPGMAYQPPLIGSKQLLNFTATSLPDVGGYLLMLAVVAGAAAVIVDWRVGRRTIGHVREAVPGLSTSGRVVDEHDHPGTPAGVL
jgi:copper chaperone NosL